MQQAQLIRVIEAIAPPALACSWDKSGIQVAAARRDIHHLAVSLDPTPSAVRSALEAGAQMLLTHHPLSLTPRFPDRLDAHHHVLSLLFSHDMPLYAAHTSLDANPEGPASWLADELGLTDRVLLEPTATITRADVSPLKGGLGCAGTLPHPLPFLELVRACAAFLPLDRLNRSARLVGSLPPLIHRVAVCTGSGASLVDEARTAGAELFITGDVKYHDAVDIVEYITPGSPEDAAATGAFALLDVGHFALEEEMSRRLAAELAQRLPELAVTFIPSADPFHPVELNS